MKLTENRANFLPDLFGGHYLRGEAYVYNFMTQMCPDYNGGYWDFYEADNGAKFMVPTDAPEYDLAWWGNGFEATVSPKVAGIIVTLFALAHLGSPRYHDLLDYAATLPEAGTIYRAVD